MEKSSSKLHLEYFLQTKPCSRENQGETTYMFSRTYCESLYSTDLILGDLSEEYNSVFSFSFIGPHFPHAFKKLLSTPVLAYLTYSSWVSENLKGIQCD